jgi:hypothetical protein
VNIATLKNEISAEKGTDITQLLYQRRMLVLVQKCLCDREHFEDGSFFSSLLYGGVGLDG